MGTNTTINALNCIWPRVTENKEPHCEAVSDDPRCSEDVALSNSKSLILAFYRSMKGPDLRRGWFWTQQLVRGSNANVCTRSNTTLLCTSIVWLLALVHAVNGGRGASSDFTAASLSLPSPPFPASNQWGQRDPCLLVMLGTIGNQRYYFSVEDPTKAATLRSVFAPGAR
ncbi:hypothetical protein JOB18_045967 [Solea senegalensis]|uniref:Uncharacterized protein n=1 Tax=Solea senegalensis TaxID=28829 RepID=A0AAV6S777_SOLSE|nr:hypothetical protein JOB18_045967 [Solea senegalensis]